MAAEPDYKKAVEKQMDSLPDDFIVAVVSSPEKYNAVNMAIMNYLTNERKMSGLYITMNKPFQAIEKSLKRNGVDTKKTVFC